MSKAAPGIADYGLLILLATIWGSAFLLSKIAVAEVPPITITMIRQILAGFVLLVLAVVLGKKWFVPKGKEFLYMSIAALMGTVVPFTLINWGVAVIDSGLAAILMGFMPIVVLLLAHITTSDEKLTAPRLAGVVLGLVGLAVLFWPQLVAGFGDNLIRQVAVLGAATAYGINALAMKKLTHYPPMTLMTYITAGSCVMLIPLAFMFETPLSVRPSGDVTMALIGLGIVPSAMGALLMFAIIERQGATFFGQINLLVPVAGVALGILFLGERLSANAFIALIVIFSGVAVARYRPARHTEPQRG